VEHEPTSGKFERSRRDRDICRDYRVVHQSRQVRIGYCRAVYDGSRRLAVRFIRRLVWPVDVYHFYFNRLACSERDPAGVDLAIVPYWQRKDYRIWGRFPVCATGAAVDMAVSCIL
jgi:hypothetical protein